MYNKNNISRLFATSPTIYSLLRDAHNSRIARNFLTTYFEEQIRLLSRRTQKIQPLEWSLQMSCLQVLKRIFSIRSERLAKHNIIHLLWLLANEKYDELPGDLNDGFFEEMIHLFLGSQGRSKIYEQELYPDYMHLQGREASIVRSDRLDRLADMTRRYIDRYPSGLDEDIQQVRRENRKRIMNHFNASEDDWNDYLWHIRHVIKSSHLLGALIDLTDEEKKSIDKATSSGIPFGITPYYVSLMDEEPGRERDHAIRAQVIPPLDYAEAMIAHKDDPSYCLDFMLEKDTSPIELITRRYPQIVILKPYNTCSQICVYCQRNWEIEDVLNSKALATKKNILAAIDWLHEHPLINEILVTGGDPLVMNDGRIDFVLSKLAELKHIERIRIGSRTPVVLPQRINDAMVNMIAKYHVPGKREIAIVTHFEHPYEITPESMQSVQKFKLKGMSVYNQAVFTVENSRRFELAALRRMLRLIGVDPYYTFNTKGKEETKNYRVPLARLEQEIKEEARLIPGLVRTDEAVYNVPRLGKNYLRAEQHHSLLTITPDGRRIYEFHPWEKKLALADSYIDVDVSIYDYLQELKKRGENLEDYKTIWYYF